MFEKEAEEYIEKLIEDWNDGEYSFSVDDMRKAILYFAEFGYNKANEWHYMKDVNCYEDLHFPPEEEEKGRVLIWKVHVITEKELRNLYVIIVEVMVICGMK